MDIEMVRILQRRSSILMLSTDRGTTPKFQLIQLMGL